MIVHCLQIDWVLCPAFLPFRCHQVWNPIKPPRGIPDLISRFRGSSVVKVLRLRLEPTHSCHTNIYAVMLYALCGEPQSKMRQVAGGDPVSQPCDPNMLKNACTNDRRDDRFM